MKEERKKELLETIKRYVDRECPIIAIMADNINHDVGYCVAGTPTSTGRMLVEVLKQFPELRESIEAVLQAVKNIEAKTKDNGKTTTD